MPGTGTATLDFGAFPGASHATVAVTGQGSIVAGSLVEAWIRPAATADHSSDEHMLEPLKVFAADIVAGVGFTIHGFNVNELLPRVINLELHTSSGAGVQRDRLGGQNAPDQQQHMGTRLYGQFTVAWAWY
jgi:hypothetical protein